MLGFHNITGDANIIFNKVCLIHKRFQWEILRGNMSIINTMSFNLSNMHSQDYLNLKKSGRHHSPWEDEKVEAHIPTQHKSV